MPVYQHCCPAHGLFDDIRPFAESGADAACPACGTLCGREITAPRLAILDHATRVAHATNERSRHAPHVCGAGCSHHHRKPAAATPPKAEVYRGPRPWVIEHG